MNKNKDRLASLVVSPNDTLLHAVKRMDEVRCKLLLVIENGHFVGLVSIGDIQRAIIRNVPLSEGD
jgi:CBS domain-containing protein